jgi:hypothetical protein
MGWTSGPELGQKDLEEMIGEIDGRHKETERSTVNTHEILPQWPGMEASESGWTQDVLKRIQKLYGGTKRPNWRIVQKQFW